MRNSYAKFEKANIGVFGFSVDSVYSHAAFAAELGGLPFELIADFERRVVDSWGVRRTDLEGYDGVPRRTVFILDPERRVRWRWVTSPEQRLPDVKEVLAEAKKVAAEKAAATRPGRPASDRSTRPASPGKPATEARTPARKGAARPR